LHVRAAHFDSDGQRVFVIRGGKPSDSSPSDRDLPGAVETGTVGILEADSLKETGVFRGHGGEVTAGCLSPDGRYFATASLDGTARTWDVNGPERVGNTIAAGGPPSVFPDELGMRISELDAPILRQDGRLIFASDINRYRRGEADEFARIIDVATGNVIS